MLIEFKNNSFNFVNYLIKIFPYIFSKIILNLRENLVTLVIKSADLDFLLNFLKKHNLLQFKTLIGITAVDYPKNINRFELNYFLLSYKLNRRLIIKTITDDITPIPSISHIFSSAEWYEREVWDLFGIFFFNNLDLRRILTDYGFEGHPFRKDFPQMGFVEVRYDDQDKFVKYEPIEMVQEYRLFEFSTPWLNVK